MLDHEIKEVWKIGGYVRYMDDFVLFFQEKADLKAALLQVERFLTEKLLLELNPPVFNRTGHGIPFLSYRVQGAALRLSLKAKRRFAGKIRRANLAESAEHALPLLAFINRADTVGFRRKIFHGISSARLEPRKPRRQLEQQRQELPFSEPEQQFARESQQQPRFPPRSGPQLKDVTDIHH